MNFLKLENINILIYSVMHMVIMAAAVFMVFGFVVIILTAVSGVVGVFSGLSAAANLQGTVSSIAAIITGPAQPDICMCGPGSPCYPSRHTRHGPGCGYRVCGRHTP